MTSGKRSFSNLKVIKTYLRKSIQQEHLNSLAIVSIESEIHRGSVGQNSEELAKVKARK